jgi:hypothetical protein
MSDLPLDLDLSAEELLVLQEALSELRKRALAQKYRVPEFVVEYISSFDPHPSAGYTDWILFQIKEGNLRAKWDDSKVDFEDGEKVRQLLTQFIKLLRKQNFKGSRDINQYGSYAELAQELEKYTGEREEVQKRSVLDLIKPSDIVVDQGRYKVVRVYEYPVAKALFKGTHWCVQQEGYFDEYNIDYDNPLYCVLKDLHPYVLLHYESRQAKDVYDSAISRDTALEIRPVVVALEKKEGKYTRSGDFVMFLTAGEAVQDASLAYDYAWEVLHSRFPEGEEAISRDPGNSYLYAKDIIKGPWPKGEDVISKSAYYSFLYAKDVIRGPWPKGEKTILRNDFWDMYISFLSTLGRGVADAAIKRVQGK